MFPTKDFTDNVVDISGNPHAGQKKINLLEKRKGKRTANSKK